MRGKKTKRQIHAGIICCMILVYISSVGVIAQDIQPQSIQVSSQLSPRNNDVPVSNFSGEWIYYDGGETGEGIGLTNGGSFESAIRLTPEELELYEYWDLSMVGFYHSSESTHFGYIKLYLEGNSTTPGDMFFIQPYTVSGQGWHEILLDEAVVVHASSDIWVGVELSHQQGEYPMGVDSGPAVLGKGCFIYFMDEWFEMTELGIDINWNIRVFVDDLTAPTTRCDLTGHMQGEFYVSDVDVELIASDMVSGVKYTMYKINDEEWMLYTQPFVVGGDGEYTIYFYSVDIAGNSEETQAKSFIINTQGYGTIEIELVGRIGVNAFLYNNGSIDMYDIAWSIVFEGGSLLYGGDSLGVVDIASYSEVLISTRLILGFGRTTITITAGEQSLQQQAFLFGPFVLYR
jgi:hypothetical protein